jgi:aldehyde dehydrogenase
MATDTRSRAEVVEARMLIGGRWIDAEDRIQVRNPARTSEVVGSVPRGTPADARAAVEAATAAFAGWSRVPIGKRAEILRRAAEALIAGEGERAILLARENGQLLAEAQGGVRGCAPTLKYYAGLGDATDLVEEMAGPNGTVLVKKQPMGVAVLIVPWNAPTRLAFLGLAPILLAGNTVVIKPPTEAPLSLIDAIAAIHELFPPGVINVVTGPGDEIGRELIKHPLVRKINFTGSTESGKEILRLAADTVKRVSLELGGNDPAIVLPDVDLDEAVPELVRGVFGLSGQMCYDVKRIYVDRSIHQEFVAAFKAAADTLVVGDGLDPRTTMGSLISERQRDRIRHLVEDARSQGGEVEVVGQQLDAGAWDGGWFHLPTVVTGVDERCELVAREQFGPAIPILPFSTVDEAIARANATDYGLAASVWSRDETRAFEIAGQLQAGSAFVNVHRLGASGDDMPFGGFKESGLGRSHGLIALEEQFELQTISSRRPPG